MKTVLLVVSALLVAAVHAEYSTSQLRTLWAPACDTSKLSTITLLGPTGAKITIDSRTIPYWQRLFEIMYAYGYYPPKATTGAYNCRQITGGTGYSLHAYGIAGDFWWDLNPYGSTLITNMPQGMIDEILAIRTNGNNVVFRWGGYYSTNKDAMHYEVVASPAEIATGIKPNTCTVGSTPGVCMAQSRCSGTVNTGASLCPSSAGQAKLICCTGGSTPPPIPEPPSCVVNGVYGKCINQTSCYGIVTSGLCPGPAAIKCCTNVNCYAGGLNGTCKDTATCTGTSTSGLCPGPSNIQCCTKPKPPGCVAGGVQGQCIDEDDCAGTVTAGLCPGAANIKCCTQDDKPPNPSFATVPGRGTNTDCTMVPSKLINTAGMTGLDLGMATIFNTKGAYLYRKAAELQVKPAALAATIRIESGGNGFSPDGRMIIRFENHVFWRYYTGSGTKPEETATFNAHYTYNPSTTFQGHAFRYNPTDAWQTFHGNQQKEWDVLTYSQNLDDTAALLSHSMGAPQVMGFNYRTLGYATVQEMFIAFSTSLETQLNGMFEFIKAHPNCLNGLKNQDYAMFAGCYNGNGQIPTYSANILAAANSYTSVTNGMCGDATGRVGTCQDESTCTGTTATGLCPGASNIKCCFSNGATPAPSPVTTYGTCTVKGEPGVCIDTAKCTGTATPGYCPGAANIQCCVNPSTPLDFGPCVVGSTSGRCLDEKSCMGTATASSQCPTNSFGASAKCCTAGACSAYSAFVNLTYIEDYQANHSPWINDPSYLSAAMPTASVLYSLFIALMAVAALLH